MSQQVDVQHARRVVAQHAKTSSLFGVDFVPVRGSLDPKPDADTGGAVKALKALRARYEEEKPHEPFISS